MVGLLSKSRDSFFHSNYCNWEWMDKRGNHSRATVLCQLSLSENYMGDASQTCKLPKSWTISTASSPFVRIWSWDICPGNVADHLSWHVLAAACTPAVARMIQTKRWENMRLWAVTCWVVRGSSLDETVNHLIMVLQLKPTWLKDTAPARLSNILFQWSLALICSSSFGWTSQLLRSNGTRLEESLSVLEHHWGTQLPFWDIE